MQEIEDCAERGFESGQFATILAMVASGMGISAVPKMAVQPARGCRFIRLANNGATRVLGATMLGRHFQTRAQRVFLQHLRYNGAKQSKMARTSVHLDHRKIPALTDEACNYASPS